MEAELARLGITGTLSKLYIAAIELGEATIADVAARAGLVRTTAYNALMRLEEEGLVILEERNGRRYVIAEDPRVLVDRLDSRKQMLNEVMPQLRSFYNRIKGKPQIRFHEGEGGIRTALWDCLTVKGEPKVLRGILSMHELMETPGLDEMNRFIDERARRGIELKVIRSQDREVDKIWSSSQSQHRELRYAPPDVTLPMTMFVYDHRVCLISSRNENYGMIIESEEFATMQRALFDTTWVQSAPTPKID